MRYKVMNILLSVFECNPLRGSDSYVGWSFVVNVAKYNNVYALMRTTNKIDIEKYCMDMKVDLTNIHFIYIDQSKIFTEIIYKINRYLGFLCFYFDWQKSAYKVAKKLVNEIKIDVCHHVSITDFRCVGKIWKLDIPFILDLLLVDKNLRVASRTMWKVIGKVNGFVNG